MKAGLLLALSAALTLGFVAASLALPGNWIFALGCVGAAIGLGAGWERT